MNANHKILIFRLIKILIFKSCVLGIDSKCSLENIECKQMNPESETSYDFIYQMSFFSARIPQCISTGLLFQIQATFYLRKTTQNTLTEKAENWMFLSGQMS